MPDIETIRLHRYWTTVSKVFKHLWGPNHTLLHFIGSPHEMEAIEGAELVIHEMAHQKLMPESYVFTPTQMSTMSVTDYIEGLPLYLRDLHEIRALAIELLVGRLLELNLNEERIIELSAQNTNLFKERKPKLKQLVHKAVMHPKLFIKAKSIVSMFKKHKKEMRIR